MSVYDLMILFIDNGFDIEIWDTDSELTIYQGPGDDIPDDLCELEVCSIDTPQAGCPFTINVDTGDGLY